MFKLFLFWILGMCSGSMILHVSFLELSGMRHVIVKWMGIRPEDEIAHFRIAMLFEVGHHKLVQGTLKVSVIFLQRCHEKSMPAALNAKKKSGQRPISGRLGGVLRHAGARWVFWMHGVCVQGFFFGWLGNIPAKFALPKPLVFGVTIFLRAKARNVWAVGLSLPRPALKKTVTDLW